MNLVTNLMHVCQIDSIFHLNENCSPVDGFFFFPPHWNQNVSTVLILFHDTSSATLCQCLQILVLKISTPLNKMGDTDVCSVRNIANNQNLFCRLQCVRFRGRHHFNIFVQILKKSLYWYPVAFRSFAVSGRFVHTQ